MTGLEIQQARLDKGWTQADLAQRVGRSQTTISMIEGGRMVPPATLLQRIQSALAEEAGPTASREPKRATAPTLTLPDLSTPRAAEGVSLPVREEAWKRPRESGDFTVCLPLAGETLLVAAVDVAGHGLAVLPSALYLQGWLRGWTQALTSPPRLQTLVEAFSRALSMAAIEAGGYFGLLSRFRGAPHTLSYEAVAYGFPPPLLINVPPLRTLTSAGLGSPLPAPRQDLSAQPARIDRLPTPWRLVVASDGLLSRLGEGNEERGRRALLQWQAGPHRDEPPEKHLETGVPLTDDESFLLLQWAGWDRDQTFAVTDDAERHRLIRTLGQEIEADVGPRRAAAFLQAVVEALDNARRHGGAGIVTVRSRQEEQRWRVEVEDQGPDDVTDKKIRRPEGGFALMRRGAQVVDVRRGREGGTIVSLVLETKLPGKAPGG